MPTDILTPGSASLAPRSRMAGGSANPDGLTEDACAGCGDEDVYGETALFGWSCSIPEEGVVGPVGTVSASGCHLDCGPSPGDGATYRPAGRTDLMPKREASGT